MKERNLRLLGHKAAGILLATSFFSGGSAPVISNTTLSVPSCQHFLESYTPDMDTSLLNGAEALYYKKPFGLLVYPSPSRARETIAPVVMVLESETAPGSGPLTELENAYKNLPAYETLQQMQDTHVNNTTFARERREMQLAESQLRKTVEACERVVPVSQRRDRWYVQEQTDQIASAFWEKYGLPVIIVLGFLGIGALEKLFIGDKNS